MLCWLQQLGKILIYSGSNIRRLKETLDMDKSVFYLRHNLSKHNANGTTRAANTVHKIVLLQYSRTSDISEQDMI
jgi:hypothetical protein